MALYTGEAVRIRAVLIDPDTDGPFVPHEGDPNPVAKITLWSPGKKPDKNLADRQDVNHEGDMEYREAERDFIVFIHTRGPGIEHDAIGEKWEAGKWSYRVTVTGNVFDNWEYGSFTLRP